MEGLDKPPDHFNLHKISDDMTAIPAQESKQGGKNEKRYTIEQYLAMEETSLINHEYDNGNLIPMAGGTNAHSKIKASFVMALGIAVRKLEKNWDVYNSDIRILIPATGKIVLPDAALSLADSETAYPKSPVGVLVNPTLIVEVCSADSESYDRGEKFARYRTLPSFIEYVLVSQKEPRVETFVKENGKWFLNEDASGMDAEVNLASLGVKIALRDIYRNVSFESKTSQKSGRAKK